MVKLNKISFDLKQKHIFESNSQPKTTLEYTQVWDRTVLAGRRCLGKGCEADKMVHERATKFVKEVKPTTVERRPWSSEEWRRRSRMRSKIFQT